MSGVVALVPSSAIQKILFDFQGSVKKSYIKETVPYLASPASFLSRR